MSIDITKHICELLYDHDLVVIPDLGCIVASYQSAAIDHVQGQIHPPMKKLAFEEKGESNDDFLVKDIKEKNNISFKEAVTLTNQFVSQIKEKLDNKEIVILPRIGRLYKDYENNLRFLQDTTNFNKTVFGLPTLQFYPILRTQESPTIKKNKPAKLVADKAGFGVASTFSRKVASIFLPLFLGIVVVLFSIGIYKKQNKQIAVNPHIQKIPINETRINQKPSMDNMSMYEGLSGDDSAEINLENATTTTPDETMDINAARATIEEPQKKCIIIVGVFSQKSSVEKRVKDIYDLGYGAYEDKVGSLTRVGVEFGYEREKEIKTMLRIIRRKLDDRAWILEE